MLPVTPLAELSIPRRFQSRLYMHEGELDLLVGLFATVKPRAVIEFGINVGLTACALLDNLPDIECYQGIDLSPGGRPTLRQQDPEVPDEPGWMVRDDERFELVLRLRGSLDLAPKDLMSADAVFIDGDHSYAAVMHDSLLAYDLVREGGIIVWHDYGNPAVEVNRALDELSRSGHAIHSVEATWLAYERR